MMKRKEMKRSAIRAKTYFLSYFLCVPRSFKSSIKFSHRGQQGTNLCLRFAARKHTIRSRADDSKKLNRSISAASSPPSSAFCSLLAARVSMLSFWLTNLVQVYFRTFLLSLIPRWQSLVIIEYVTKCFVSPVVNPLIASATDPVSTYSSCCCWSRWTLPNHPHHPERVHSTAGFVAFAVCSIQRHHQWLAPGWWRLVLVYV